MEEPFDTSQKEVAASAPPGDGAARGPKLRRGAVRGRAAGDRPPGRGGVHAVPNAVLPHPFRPAAGEGDGLLRPLPDPHAGVPPPGGLACWDILGQDGRVGCRGILDSGPLG